LIKKKQKIKEKRLLRLFSGPTHTDSGKLRAFANWVMIVENLTACCTTTLEALLFRLPSWFKKTFYKRRKRGAGSIP